jgi:serine protease SohB
MEQLIEIAVFFAKTLIFVGGTVVVLIALFQLAGRSRQTRVHLEIEKLNKRYRSYRHALNTHLLKKKDLKVFEKKIKKDKSNFDRKVFVLDFDGDLRAVAVDHLREEVTAVLAVAQPDDEVVVRVESPGGVVHGYGLAAAQLRRIRDKGIPLTVCVDKIAASGGYMMACVADRILAAPFAIIGSVGVVASLPNFHRLLEKHDIDYKEVTAGEFKRTVSVFGEITPAGFEKFKEQLQDTHVLFKTFVQSNRPQLDVDKIATGEYWFGMRALELNLVDELRTSDDYLWGLHETRELLRIKHHGKRSISDRLSEIASVTSERIFERAIRNGFLARFGM